jgi:hypothetical protein
LVAHGSLSLGVEEIRHSLHKQKGLVRV